MSDLSTQSIVYLQGVGPKKGELLKSELKIVSFEDLIYYFPYKYIDRSRFYSIRELTGDMPFVQIRARVVGVRQIGEGVQKRLIATVADSSGQLELLWFKGQKFVIDKLVPNTEFIVFGKPSQFNGQINMVHPDLESIKDGNATFYQGLQPLYNTTEKLKSGFINSKSILKLVQSVFEVIKGKIPETLPAYLVQNCNLMQLDTALRTTHFPVQSQILETARYRLKFEELFYLQLNILRIKGLRQLSIQGHYFKVVGNFTNTFYNEYLPFQLTEAQKRVIKEIRKDMGSGKQMNRLLQGDVGSGKTLVALMVMLIAADNTFQSCLMAPTEILATQHFASITQLTKGLPIEIALLTGSTKKKQRTEIHEKLLNGSINILIGTHALIEDVVQLNNLGLVVIDEQHRFGVAQRARLWKKSIHPPHVLVMTATPIPRTLAMTVYGDLDVSVIDELPPGRKPIQTVHYFHNRRNSLNRFIREQLLIGRQVYVVYPLIDESELVDFKNLTEGFDYMTRSFPEYTTVMMHGKMRPADKDAAMQQFASGEANIMVATTVIEVGVNVPNASIMVIESAERFGLAQLHQLRGRVGRGAEQSYCVLMTSPKLAEETRLRMEIMTRTNDGFEIAEADMKLRGPGDLEGTQQSGLPFDLKIANLGRDQSILLQARDVAQEVIAHDAKLEKPENSILARQLQKLARRKINWGMIS